MNPGKLPLDVLARILGDIEIADPRVALGPRLGEDAALIDFGDRYLVAKTDPITFATDRIGWYMVNVNANDIAVMGATPRWLMATLLLPDGVTERQVSDIFDQIKAACAELNIAPIGGHTEITYGLDRPIAVGAMLGEVAKEDAILSSGVRPGDALLLTKGIAVEGASILANESESELLSRGVGADAIAAARRFLFEPGISVVADARIALATGAVQAMHDPTEGGLSGGLYELAAASGLGLEIDTDAIPILPEASEICAALDLNPLGLIASGSLLAAVPPDDAPPIIAALSAAGIPAAVIGRATDRHSDVTLSTADGTAIPFPTFQRDEIARYFDPLSASD